MKIFLLILGVILLATVDARSGSTAVGARNSSGTPDGDYRIVGDSGNTQAQGVFKDGKMDGKWLFFDSHHVKVAEVTYENGAASGPYQTFFGSKANPSAAGKLESTGRMQAGGVVGRHVGYEPTGKVFTDATLENGRARQTTVGSEEVATRTAQEDVRFVKTIEGIVRAAVR